MTYYKLCEINALLAGEPKQFNIKGNEFIVINQNSQFYCLEARCTHAGAPLVEGDLSGDILTCPWHDSRFNIATGAVIKGPADKPLKIYKIVINENSLYVEL